MGIRAFLLCGMLVLLVSVGRADDKLQPEALPMPREVPPSDVLPAPRVLPGPFFETYWVPDAPPQFGRRSVWQMMSPNYMGQMRPTVIYTPSGEGYYRSNGAWYPWTTTRPHLYRGYLVD
jgi:hypothetical protein